MDKILLKIIETESIRTIINSAIILFILYVIYNLFFKNYILDLKRTIDTFNVTIKANNEATKIVIFYELQREFYERKEKGFKSINADERWQNMWDQYVFLGDGKGDTLKREWDALPIK